MPIQGLKSETHTFCTYRKEPTTTALAASSLVVCLSAVLYGPIMTTDFSRCTQENGVEIGEVPYPMYWRDI